MRHGFYKKTNLLLVSGLVALLLFGIPLSANAESVTISPHKIVLNAKGQFEDLQAEVRIYLDGGITVQDFSINLWFEDVEVAHALAARYCVVDDVLLVSFDRRFIQENPDIEPFIGKEITATVEGWVNAVKADGETIVYKEFSGTDTVEIVNPGKG